MGISELVGSIDWEHDSYPEFQDFAVLPFFILFFPTVRFFLDRFVFEVLYHVYVYIFGSVIYVW